MHDLKESHNLKVHMVQMLGKLLIFSDACYRSPVAFLLTSCLRIHIMHRTCHVNFIECVSLGQSDLHLANQDHLRLPGDTSTHGVTPIHVSCALSVSLQQSTLTVAPFWLGGFDTELEVVRKRITCVTSEGLENCNHQNQNPVLCNIREAIIMGILIGY